MVLYTLLINLYQTVHNRGVLFLYSFCLCSLNGSIIWLVHVSILNAMRAGGN